MAPCPQPTPVNVGNEEDHEMSEMEKGDVDGLIPSNNALLFPIRQEMLQFPTEISLDRQRVDWKEEEGSVHPMVSSNHRSGAFAETIDMDIENYCENNSAAMIDDEENDSSALLSNPEMIIALEKQLLHDDNSCPSLNSTMSMDSSTSSSDDSASVIDDYGKEDESFYDEDLFQDEELKDIIRRALDETDISSIDYIHAHQSVESSSHSSNDDEDTESNYCDDDDDGLAMELRNRLEGFDDCLHCEELELLNDDELKLMLGFAIWETDLDYIDTHLYVPIYDEKEQDDGMDDEERNLNAISEQIRREIDLLQFKQVEAEVVDAEGTTDILFQLQSIVTRIMDANRRKAVDRPILGFRHFWSHRVRVCHPVHNLSKSYNDHGTIVATSPSNALCVSNAGIVPPENVVKVDFFRRQRLPGSFLLESASNTIPFFIMNSDQEATLSDQANLQMTKTKNVVGSQDQMQSMVLVDQMAVVILTSINNRKPGGPPLRFGTFIISPYYQEKFGRVDSIRPFCQLENTHDRNIATSLVIEQSSNVCRHSALVSLSSGENMDIKLFKVDSSIFSTSDVTMESGQLPGRTKLSDVERKRDIEFCAEYSNRLINGGQSSHSASKGRLISLLESEKEHRSMPVEIAYGADGASVQSDISPITYQDVAFDKACLSKDEYLFRLSNLLEFDVPLEVARDAPLFDPEEDSQIGSEATGDQILKTLEATLASPEPPNLDSNDILQDCGSLKPLDTQEVFDCDSNNGDYMFSLEPLVQISSSTDVSEEESNDLGISTTQLDQNSVGTSEDSVQEIASEAMKSQDNTIPSLVQSEESSSLSSSEICPDDSFCEPEADEIVSAGIRIDSASFATEVSVEQILGRNDESKLNLQDVIVSSTEIGCARRACTTSSDTSEEFGRYEVEWQDYKSISNRPYSSTLGHNDHPDAAFSAVVSSNAPAAPYLERRCDLKLHGVDNVGNSFMEWLHVEEDSNEETSCAYEQEVSILNVSERGITGSSDKLDHLVNKETSQLLQTIRSCDSCDDGITRDSIDFDVCSDTGKSNGAISCDIASGIEANAAKNPSAVYSRQELAFQHDPAVAISGKGAEESVHYDSSTILHRAEVGPANDLFLPDNHHIIEEDIFDPSISIDDFAVEMEICEVYTHASESSIEEMSMSSCDDMSLSSFDGEMVDRVSSGGVQLVDEDDDIFELTLVDEKCFTSTRNASSLVIDDELRGEPQVSQILPGTDCEVDIQPTGYRDIKRQKHLAGESRFSESNCIFESKEGSSIMELKAKSFDRSGSEVFREENAYPFLKTEESVSSIHSRSSGSSGREDHFASNPPFKATTASAHVVVDFPDGIEVGISSNYVDSNRKSSQMKCGWFEGVRTRIESSIGSASYSCPSTEDTTAYSGSLSSFSGDEGTIEHGFTSQLFSPANAKLRGNRTGRQAYEYAGGRRSQTARDSGRMLWRSTISMIRGFAT